MTTRLRLIRIRWWWIVSLPRSTDFSICPTATSRPPLGTAPACGTVFTTPSTRAPLPPTTLPPACWSQRCWTSGAVARLVVWAPAATICAPPSGTAPPGPPLPSTATRSSPARTSAMRTPRWACAAPLMTPARRRRWHTTPPPPATNPARLSPPAPMVLPSTPTRSWCPRLVVLARTSIGATPTTRPAGSATTWTTSTLSTATTGWARCMSSGSRCPRSSSSARHPAAAMPTRPWPPVSCGWWTKPTRSTTRSAACRSET
mmetsp:Transcript_9383/g.14936  ORF Transcript_9383/g.14936 Transcript_9383/m.14936 type:complete len:260 (-) Transcript_9383:2154-2933(-)